MRRKTCLFNLGHFLFLLLPLCGFNGQESVCYVFVTLPTVPLNYYKVLDLLNRKAQVNNFVFLESKLLLPIPVWRRTKQMSFNLHSKLTALHILPKLIWWQLCPFTPEKFSDEIPLEMSLFYMHLILYTLYFEFPTFFFSKMYPLNNTFKDAVVLNSNGTTK